MTRSGVELLRLHCEEVWSKGRVELLPEIFHENTRNWLMPAHFAEGIAGIRDMVLGFRQVVPDLVCVLDEAVEHGGTVWGRGYFAGTHTGGVLYGLAPTGRRFRMNVLGWCRVLDGRLSEEWAICDELETLRLLTIGNGATPYDPTALPVRRNSLDR